jgi:hypothetical protein
MNVLSKVVRKELTMVLGSQLMAQKIRQLKDETKAAHSVEMRVLSKVLQRALELQMLEQTSGESKDFPK